MISNNIEQLDYIVVIVSSKSIMFIKSSYPEDGFTVELEAIRLCILFIFREVTVY